MITTKRHSDGQLEQITRKRKQMLHEVLSVSKQELDFDEMTDEEIIDAGYCPVCYAKLQYRGGCQECPNGCVGFCG